MPVEEFIFLVKNSNTMSSVLNVFGLENKGNNYKTCKQRIIELGLDTSHFLNRIESSNLSRRVTLEELKSRLTENSKLNRTSLKIQLLHHKLLEYKCYCCGNIGEWMGKKLSLHLEHKNGKSNDNRIENLTILCPNCHTQTSTYAGKNPHKPKKPSEIDPKWRNRPHLERRKVIRPSKEILMDDLINMSFVAVGKKYGVSDNSIRKWCKSYGI